jgi:hypothetical protein
MTSLTLTDVLGRHLQIEERLVLHHGQDQAAPNDLVRVGDHVGGGGVRGPVHQPDVILCDFVADVEVRARDHDLLGRYRYGLGRDALDVVIGPVREHTACGDGEHEHDEDPHSSHMSSSSWMSDCPSEP